MSESWLPVISALIGAAIGGSIGFIGSYLIEKRRWKRQTNLEIVKTVYEPLFQEIIDILYRVKNFKPLESLENFEEIKSNPLYYGISEKIQIELIQLAESLEKYHNLCIAADGPIDRIIRETMKEHGLLKERGDPSISYRAFLGSGFVGLVRLHEGLLRGINPRELLEPKIKDLKNVTIQTTVSGYNAKETEVVDKVCERALAKAKKEPILRQFKEDQKSQVQSLNEIKDKIRFEIEKMKKV